MEKRKRKSATPAGEPPGEYLTEIDMWLRSNDFSENTMRIYGIAARRWLKYARPWEDGWRVRSMDWKKSLAKMALKSQSVLVSGAKSYLNHIIDARILEPPNPLDKVRFRRLSSEYMKRRALIDREVKAMMAACDVNTDNGVRDRTILFVMLHTALRIGSVAYIDIEDIEQRGNMWALMYRGKGDRDKDSEKLIPKGVVDEIKTYLKRTKRSMKSTGPLFLAGDRRLTIHGMRKSIVRRLKKCGIVDSAVTVHSLRHTAATKAIDSGADVKAVQDLLDHASLATTDRYVHSVRKLSQAAGLVINYDTEEQDDEGTRPRRKKRP